MARFSVCKRVRVGLALAITGALALMCVSGCNAKADELLTLDEASDGASITVAPGEYFVIQLDANPSMGYLWEVTTLNEKIVAMEESKLIKTKEASKYGGFNQRRILLRAIKTGVTRLELDFDKASDWDEDDASLDTYSLVVTVADEDEAIDESS